MPHVYSVTRKKPDTIKKNGTPVRAITLVSIKSPVSLKEASGDVWIAIINNANTNLAKSIPV